MSITTDGREDRSGSRRVGLVTAGGLAGVAAFEMALALGAPLGRAAWGGAHAHLSAGLRIASAGAAVVWFGAALAVFGLAERRGGPFAPAVSRWVTRALVWLLGIGTVMNLASSSPWERYLQAPIAFALALLCYAVTRADRQPTSAVHR